METLRFLITLITLITLINPNNPNNPNRLLMCVLQFTFACFYGLENSNMALRDSTIDTVHVLFLAIFAFDVFFRMWVHAHHYTSYYKHAHVSRPSQAYGLAKYWNYKDYHADIHFLSFCHAAEAFTLLASIVLAVLGDCSPGQCFECVW